MAGLTESQTIYYGLQLLNDHADKMWADRLFVTRASCIPVSDWSQPIWAEAARVVASYHDWIPSLQVLSFPLISQMHGRPPFEQAYLDARAYYPRPSPEQMESIRELAEKLRLEHQGSPTVQYDVELLADVGFALARRSRISSPIFQEVKSLPGATEVDGGMQLWLCSELRDFIIANGLEPHPELLQAIADEVKHVEGFGPWALLLEKAATCSDPAKYPPELETALKSMDVKGLEWTP